MSVLCLSRHVCCFTVYTLWRGWVWTRDTVIYACGTKFQTQVKTCRTDWDCRWKPSRLLYLLFCSYFAANMSGGSIESQVFHLCERITKYRCISVIQTFQRCLMLSARLLFLLHFNKAKLWTLWRAKERRPLLFSVMAGLCSPAEQGGSCNSEQYRCNPFFDQMWVAVAEWRCLCFWSLTQRAEETLNVKMPTFVTNIEHLMRPNCIKSTHAHPRTISNNICQVWSQSDELFLWYVRDRQTEIPCF